MLTVEAKKDQIEVKVSVTVPEASTWTYQFLWNCASEPYAALLAAAMRKEMWDSLKEIRRRAYEKGWRDARAHKSGKDNWHSGSWA